MELITPDGLYRLTPRTGHHHQLRVHTAPLEIPITGDPLHPNVIYIAPDDFSTPLGCWRSVIEFGDPLSGEHREFVSRCLSP